ncbi:hypothetical protein DFH09DRAFT_1405169 [Mycena vulgaris]|nr:hypothetical protein DFH09DRAFT_1405169 [Mycena vulgaris]
MSAYTSFAVVGGGTIGLPIVSALAAQGVSVVLLSRPQATAKTVPSGVQVVKVDYTDAAAVAAVFKAHKRPREVSIVVIRVEFRTLTSFTARTGFGQQSPPQQRGPRIQIPEGPASLRTGPQQRTSGTGPHRETLAPKHITHAYHGDHFQFNLRVASSIDQRVLSQYTDDIYTIRTHSVTGNLPKTFPRVSPENTSSDDEMAPTKTTELFRGNGTAEKAHTWLRILEQTWKYDAEEKEKIYRFEKGLHPGSQAEEWWNGLGAAEKKDWAALMVAFEKKWAKPKPTRRAQDVVIQELMSNFLDRDSLGKYVLDEDGNSVLSHVAWAEATRTLLGELVGGDAGMMLKSAIRGTLPVELRQLLNDAGLDNWEKWLTAVEGISIDRINDAVEERTQRHITITSGWQRDNPNATPAQREAHFQAQTAQMANELGITNFFTSPQRTTRPPASSRGTYIPPAARQSQPAFVAAPQATPPPGPRPYQTPSSHVDPRTPWASRTSSDIFGGSTVRAPPNMFTKNLLATPASPSVGRSAPIILSGNVAGDVDLARHLVEHARTYTNDAASIQRYTTDMAAWMSQNGNTPSPDYASFPFTPGTAPPGSRECFRCGVLTIPPHFGTRACEAQNGQRVPQREENVRKAVGAVLYPPGQRTPARISQIQEVPYDLFGGYNPDQPLYEDDQSENGEEPAV